MEQALRALRQLSAGLTTEAAVWKAAALVPADAPDADAGADGERGELYTWGRATNYQLGYGAKNEQQIPRLVQVPLGKQVTFLACGRFHSVAATSCGCVLSWGFSGASGRLGLDSDAGVAPQALPQFGPGRHQAVKVAAGVNHTLAMTSAGKLLVWGSNEKGQVGLPGESVVQPVVLKAAALQKQRVIDIAAGATHSLCIAGESGLVFAWGCNANGALGLGSPPTGPTSASQPQGLPHLKSATSLAANPCGSISVCLVSTHGDALMFGGSPVASTAADIRSLDPRFFVPGRIRRKEPDPFESQDRDWQVQRGGLAPLQWVTVSDSEAFGIDTEGAVWVWATALRPAVAELVPVSLKRAVRARLPSNELGLDGEFVLVDGEMSQELTESSSVPPSPLMPSAGYDDVEKVGISELGFSFKAGAAWAVDDSEAGHLWRLKRPKAKGWWAAERYEYLAQVSCFACGPEHQAAVTSFTAPPLPAREPSHGERVPSLQKLCEDKLCAKLTPRSFGLLCDISWELNRPGLLDQAFRFLCANAPLMFSKLHLPTLSQLPVEVLAAFEVAAKAKNAAGLGPAMASLQLEPLPENLIDTEADAAGTAGAPFGLDDFEDSLSETVRICESGQWAGAASQALSLLAVCLPGTAAGEGPTAERLGLTFPEKDEPKELKEKERKRRPVNSPAMIPKASPAMSFKASPAMSFKASPKSGVASPSLQPEIEAQDWTEVRNRPRKSSDSLVSQASPKLKADDVAFSPKGSKKGDRDSKGQGKTLASVDENTSARHLRLADFLQPAFKGKGKSQASRSKLDGPSGASGPSAVLVSAVESAGKAGARAWAVPDIDRIPLDLGDKPRPKAADGHKVITCSWGRDALPSEQSKNLPMAEIQRQEELLRRLAALGWDL
ncbi:unnamed protein product [Effrenium voratum]|nr:unnamed protein product [Effrenium voratum]